MRELAWQEVIDSDVVGRQLETFELGIYFQGPVAKMEAIGDLVIIDYDWLARLNSGAQTWVEVGVDRHYYLNQHWTTPFEDGDGRISWHLRGSGVMQIFPRGVGEIDPAQVRGLVLSS